MEKTEEEKIQGTKNLFDGLYRKRQIAYGVLFKTIKNELNLDDLENRYLVHVSDEKDIERDVNAVFAY